MSELGRDDDAQRRDFEREVYRRDPGDTEETPPTAAEEAAERVERAREAVIHAAKYVYTQAPWACLSVTLSELNAALAAQKGAK